MIHGKHQPEDCYAVPVVRCGRINLGVDDFASGAEHGDDSLTLPTYRTFLVVPCIVAGVTKRYVLENAVVSDMRTVLSGGVWPWCCAGHPGWKLLGQ